MAKPAPRADLAAAPPPHPPAGAHLGAFLELLQVGGEIAAKIDTWVRDGGTLTGPDRDILTAAAAQAEVALSRLRRTLREMA